MALSSIMDGAMPIGAETPRPFQAGKSSCSHVFLGELPGQKLSYLMISVFPPFYKEWMHHHTQLWVSCIMGAWV